MDNMETLPLQTAEWEVAEAELSAKLVLEEARQEEASKDGACLDIRKLHHVPTEQDLPASQGSVASRKESASNGTFQDVWEEISDYRRVGRLQH